MTARTLSMTRQLTSWVEASKLTVSDDAVVDGEEEPTSGTNAQHHKIQSRTALANAQRRSIHSAGQCTAYCEPQDANEMGLPCKNRSA
jgi:hypothetical protein